VIPLPVGELRGLGELWAQADEITGVEIDSRRVGPGDVFVAIGGGVAFLDDARANGAAATLVPDDAFVAMAAIGRAVRSRSDARVVGITGSTGKTSTKDVLAALCRPVSRTIAAEEGWNNEIGVPLTLTRLEPDTEVAIVEMGMRGLGQIRELCEIAQPGIGIITSIGPVHLELVGTVENVARAKAELLESLPPDGIGIVPADAPELEPFIPVGLDVRRFEPHVELADGGVRVDGVAFDFTARHQASNAAAALVAFDALGLSRPTEPVHVEFARWRCEESELPGGGILVNDAYNANPASMRAAIEHLLALASGRRTVAVLGEMAELGPDAPRYHEEIGALASKLDVVIGVGELARNYVPAEYAPDAESAVPLVRSLVRPGDAVLVKGSRAVGLEVVAEALAGAAVN
jgi:UDP-N-acetylmuramoyl-tripeptide--D-alanyl-D-alanine ligase